MTLHRSSIVAVSAVGLAAVLALAGETVAVQQTVSYIYDAIGRLTSAVYDGNWVIEYEYDPSGNITSIRSGPIVTGAGDGSEAAGLPGFYALGSGRPNPFTGRVQVRYQLPRTSLVRLTIYDASGRLVRTLVDAPQPAGYYDRLWDGLNQAGERVPSGVYFYRLEAGEFIDTKKMTMLR